MSDFKQLLETKKTELTEAKTSANTQIEQTRAAAEIQAAVLMAKQAPRNENQAYLDIMSSCKRPSLAEQALYAYPRGGKMVEGASIRLAEVIARSWGNCRVGVTILSQDSEKTEARAYAYDLQTNYMVDQDFTVPHKRTTKKGTYRLTDERDIRELVANIGSRYLRGCILRLIPADILEDAVDQVKKTMVSSDVPIKEQVKKMVIAFDEFGVSVANLEERLGHNLDAVIPQEIVTLKGIYKSLKDGMAKREDFFNVGNVKESSETNNVDGLKDILKENAKDETATKAQTKDTTSKDKKDA